MMARILPLLGTGSLTALVVLLGFIAFGVVQPKPGTATTSFDTDVAISDPRSQIDPPLRRSEIFYAAITERPVFEPSRRPYVPAPVKAPPKPETPVSAPKPAEPDIPPPDVQLLGVMSNAGSNRALIGVNGGAAIWLSEGGPVAEWTLVKIENDWVEIAQGSRKIRVGMYK